YLLALSEAVTPPDRKTRFVLFCRRSTDIGTCEYGNALSSDVPRASGAGFGHHRSFHLSIHGDADPMTGTAALPPNPSRVNLGAEEASVHSVP
ncbi:MAG: hypothetical protein ACRD1T_26810, partial [Acidimicrobiia bacterium]